MIRKKLHDYYQHQLDHLPEQNMPGIARQIKPKPQKSWSLEWIDLPGFVVVALIVASLLDPMAFINLNRFLPSISLFV